MDSEPPVGDRRCWPCTVANLAVGTAIAWVPSAVVLAAGNRGSVPVAAAWGVVVTALTVYRLAGYGHLPLAERVARVTGLHRRIGPDEPSGSKRRQPEDPSGSRDDDDGSG